MGNFLSNTLASLLLSFIPSDNLIHDHVYLQEYNSFYDKNACLVFDQAIYWDKCNCKQDECEGYKVVEWRFIKKYSQIPYYDYKVNLFISEYYDIKNLKNKEIKRRITSDSYRRTYTQYDPERYDTNIHEELERRKLKEPNEKLE